MSKYWRFTDSIAGYIRLSQPNKECGGMSVDYCEILNRAEVYSANFAVFHRPETPFPVAQLKLTLEDFDDDFFIWNGCMFVSERLRQVMALKEHGARYFDVDASQSAALPRLKNYKIMVLTAVEDVSDREESDYEMWEILPDRPLVPFMVKKVVMRADARPNHSLFHDKFFPGMFCTEEFALRILKAECKGMRFQDPAYSMGNKVYYRTLRGIEQYIDWNSRKKIEITELIESFYSP